MFYATDVFSLRKIFNESKHVRVLVQNYILQYCTFYLLLYQTSTFWVSAVPLQSETNTIPYCCYSSLHSLCNICSPLFTAVAWHLDASMSASLSLGMWACLIF